MISEYLLPRIAARIQQLGSGLADLALVVAMNLREIVNPAPAAKLPRVMKWAEAAALVAATRRNRIIAVYNLIRAIDDNDKSEAVAALNTMAGYGTITTAERDAIIAWAQAEMDDPAHKPLISWADANIADGAVVDYGDVQAARGLP